MIEIDKSICIKCSMCLSVCPQMLLKKEPEGMVLINEEYCDDCMECNENCPVEAINIKEED